MLVLGRKPGEYIVIDDKVIVRVVKTDSGKLKLQIEAPKEIAIVRGEIYEQVNTIQAE